MMNLRKTAEEIRRLRELVANQKDTIEKAMQCIDELQAENDKLNDTCAEYRHSLEMYFRLLDKYKADNAKLRAALADEDIIFPNTDPRGLSDTSNSEPEGLDNIY